MPLYPAKLYLIFSLNMASTNAKPTQRLASVIAPLGRFKAFLTWVIVSVPHGYAF